MNESINIPEVIKESKAQVETVLLKTIVRKDIYDKLKLLAQNYATGQGHWDFGVAIQILLEYFENSKIALQSDKLDMIIGILSQAPEEKEEEMIEMLGGSKISKR